MPILGASEIVTVGIVLSLFTLGIGGLAFWVWMLVDCVRREKEQQLVWVILLLFLHLLGAILYFFLRRRPRLRAAL